MKQGIPQTPQDLQRHFGEQLGFLEKSAKLFDRGDYSEAKRMAAAIRTLVHDTHRSTSLLTQLGRKTTTAFCDSSLDSATAIKGAAYSGLVQVAIRPLEGAVEHIAALDDDPNRFQWVDFEDWWRCVIFRDLEKRELTREGLILVVANQDGGAHVDPNLDEEYSRLSRGNSLGRFGGGPRGQVALEGVELAAVRQIAHEVLKTLRPGYAMKRASRGPEGIIGSVSLEFGPSKQSD